jgi:hypothetical protein
VEDHRKRMLTFDNCGSGVPEDDGIEDDDHWLGGGGPLSIKDKGDRVGGATRVEDNNMWCATATTSASTSSKTMASGQWGGLLAVAFIVSSNCMVT